MQLCMQHLYHLRLMLQKRELCVALGIDESQGLLMEAGFRKPLCRLKLTDKPVIRGLTSKVKMHMDQFAEGLNQLKVLDAMTLLCSNHFLFTVKRRCLQVKLLLRLYCNHNTFFQRS